MEAPRLEMRDISKEYFGNKVLRSVNLSVAPGEIHGLVGENGAGKSTLMNILFGMPVIRNTGGFEGRIFIDGEPVEVNSPYDALELGIGMVHQEFMLLPGLTITENIKINREIVKDNLLSKMLGKKLGILDFERMRKDARKALDRVELNIDEMLPVLGLPVGFMQFIEIARELDKDSLRLLILDEPTAVLTEKDAETLIEVMKKLSREGISILFITHRLNEVLRVADNITVLRDGEVVGKLPSSEATIEVLAELMVGRKVDISARARRGFEEDAKPILTIKDLHVDMPGERVSGLSLNVQEGEILGIGGLAGHGKIGIANGIMGLYPARGYVHVANYGEVELNSPLSALSSGMAFVSEDRRGMGLLLDETIELNIAVQALLSRGKFLKKYLFNMIDRESIRKHALKMIKDLDIRCTGPNQIVRRLSGGNQQKVCIAKALTLEPSILFVSEPTRGIDVGAKKIVLDLLLQLNQELGVTIIMTSSELAELRSICDRIAIIYRGRLQGILPVDASDKEFGLMMAGELSAVKEGVF
ncbi:sugar ABC transporter ATP-binding protein [Acetomicrobium sp.]|jgi:simple sugar transport system ATP-binding protein|uniref:sugar ABC transporter ATP-binding protein n=1 Tax=Acetomicrobium sp. TaxID=1872099 RepID=UPI0028717EB4|nr:sugar ABC transporter ATP-binding protein [Acetomicrobium sp.]MDI9378005.1 sugar ABC transporter ATP-binding protein [Synergistota bacterium]MDR9770487.1 sugar ABC transporter ATP-binding protein [Acetomicrobium sp.]HPT65321.1 sugar ABC transporter ATP-binding protein [Acetomicrobium sp.]HQC87861.1 sugar ABC transporter ATP-binding protein [Acetomicrobium sp.]HXK98756.1 sugar ABC transporter ATP-binding protein [Acetomicrobium sp.]